ncbi:MAG: O-antigen ligase family protein [Pseudomonadota bacterium]
MLIAAVLILLSFAVGGASRADVLSQLPMRVGAIVIGAAALLTMTSGAIRPVRPILLLLAAFAGVQVLQLVPLPPTLWTSLPGREIFARTATVAGVAQPWHPITLIPDATMNSALALLPGFAALLALAVVRSRDWWLVIAVFLVMAIVSGIIGLIQISSDSLYFYSITNRGSAVGIFANRNHQAALLAATIPALAVVAAVAPVKLKAGARHLTIGLVALFLLPLLLVTGSRAGLVLALVGIGGAIVLAQQWQRAHPEPAAPPRRRPARFGSPKLWLVLGAIVVIGIVTLTIVFSKGLAVQRLFSQDVEADARILLFLPMSRIAGSFFPFGAGFGTFDTVFKVFEPDWRLGPSYFNHAHNDLMEVLIEGGLASVLLIAAFLAWWVRAAFMLWRVKPVSSGVLIGRLGTVQSAILMLASVSDYPLRTPLGQVLFVFACGFMAAALYRRAHHPNEAAAEA